MYYIQSFVDYLRITPKNFYTKLNIERNQELYNTSVIDFASDVINQYLDDRYDITQKPFGTGNNLIDAFAKPIIDLFHNAVETSENMFLEIYNPKKAIYYEVPLNYNYDNKITLPTVICTTPKFKNKIFHGLYPTPLINKNTIVTLNNLYQNDIDYFEQTIPNRITISMYDTSTLSNDTDTNYFTSPITINNTHSFVANNPYQLIYPSRLFIKLDGIQYFYNEDAPTQLAYITIKGTRQNGAIYEETIKVLSNTTVSTEHEYTNFIEIKINNVYPINGITINVIPAYLNNSVIDIKDNYYSTKYGYYKNIWAQIDTETNGTDNYNAIRFYSYSNINKEVLLAGLTELDLKYVAVLNNEYSNILSLDTFDKILIDQDRSKIYAFKDNTLYLYNLYLPMPPKEMLDIMKTEYTNRIRLRSNFTFPDINEEVIIYVDQPDITKRITSLKLYVHTLTPAGTILKTQLEEINLDAPSYLLPKDTKFKYEFDEPGFYLFEAEGYYEDQTRSSYFLPLWIPVLKPLVKFDLTDSEVADNISYDYGFVSRDGKIILMDNLFTQITEIRFNKDIYFIDINKLILYEKYDNIEVEV